MSRKLGQNFTVQYNHLYRSRKETWHRCRNNGTVFGPYS